MTTTNPAALTVAEMSRLFKGFNFPIKSPQGCVMVELDAAVREIAYVSENLVKLANRMVDDLERAAANVVNGKALNPCGTLQSAAEFENKAGKLTSLREHAASLLKVAVAYGLIAADAYTI